VVLSIIWILKNSSTQKSGQLTYLLANNTMKLLWRGLVHLQTTRWSCSEGNMFLSKQPSGIIMKGNCLLARSPMKRTCLLQNNWPKLELFIDKKLIGNCFQKLIIFTFKGKLECCLHHGILMLWIKFHYIWRLKKFKRFCGA